MMAGGDVTAYLQSGTWISGAILEQKKRLAENDVRAIKNKDKTNSNINLYKNNNYTGVKNCFLPSLKRAILDSDMLDLLNSISVSLRSALQHRSGKSAVIIKSLYWQMQTE